MITDETVRVVPFHELRPGDIFLCPVSQDFFLRVELHEGMNCAKLNDGAMHNHLSTAQVDFYPSARLQI